jgi:hypothetical protein
MNLCESIKQFREPVYVRVQRSPATYQATSDYVQHKLMSLTEEYRCTRNDQQTLRLIRDDIDSALRRYHNYCIKENIGAHYVDPDLEGSGIFEHMIPASTVRDLLIHDVITAQQACNMPTCRLSRHKDDLLREGGWASKTPDIYNFWLRYKYCFDLKGFATYDGVGIDADHWNLEDHFEYFVGNSHTV